jgi:hypothetical protein
MECKKVRALSRGIRKMSSALQLRILLMRHLTIRQFAVILSA